MKIPKVLVSAVLWGCSGGSTMSDGGTDSGVPDAGHSDAGYVDGGDPNAPCTLDMQCDAGAGEFPGYCVAFTYDDGGTYPFCEAAV